ncbi:MAG: hypothetical protein JKY27_01620 [Magnetovibrio sp.]|nr:hypothetical protein [Magnetovibrio sp.]
MTVVKRSLKALITTCLVAIVLWPVGAGAQSTKAPTVVETYRIGDNAFVRALKADPNQNSLWVGTSVGAIEVDLSSHNMKNVFTRAEGLANEYIFAIGIGPKKRIWLGTNAGGLSRSKPDGGWETFFPMHGLADYWVYSFAFDKQGKAWIGTWDGVSVMDADGDAMTTYRKELINVWVYGLGVDAKGRVWLGTEGGVSMHDAGTWSSWDHDDGLGAINAQELQRSTNTGLGTRSRHDLSVAGSAGQETFNPNYVFAVKVDEQTQDIWFGTWGGGASRFNGKDEWTSLTTKDGLAGNIVYAIAQEPDGTLWFGTNRGASRFDGETWTTFDMSTGLTGANVFAIEIDQNNDVWLGTKGGVTRLTYKSSQEKE